MPLLVGLDGEKKMSKSLKNAVGILDEPFEMYGKIMSIPDAAMDSYALLLTGIPEGEIRSSHPRDAKARIALEITTRFHGAEKAGEAQERFVHQFSRRETPAEIPDFLLPDSGPVRLSTVMVRAGAARSESQAKQLIGQKAVDLDGTPVTDPFAEVVASGQILRVGKRFYCRLVRG
jgi:tyrosyl-tRNA synthetase